MDVNDRPHPDLGAPLSVEEAEEMRRVTEIEKATRLVAQATPDDLVDEIAFLLARDAEIRRLRATLAMLMHHCTAHEQSAKLVGATAWYVVTVPDPIERARAVLAGGDAQDAGR